MRTQFRVLKRYSVWHVELPLGFEQWRRIWGGYVSSRLAVNTSGTTERVCPSRTHQVKFLQICQGYLCLFGFIYVKPCQMNQKFKQCETQKQHSAGVLIFSKNVGNRLQISYARRVTWRMSHTEGPQFWSDLWSTSANFLLGIWELKHIFVWEGKR